MSCLKCQTIIIDPNIAHYGLHPECFTEWFNAPNGTEFISLQRKHTSSTSNQSPNLSPQNTSFFHGKFKKYSADLNGSSYILKMRQGDAPELPEVEYLCNQIGKTLSIPVAEFYYIDFNGEKTFVTKNFIRPGAPTDLQHIYHFRPDDQHSCEGIIRVITEKTQRPNDVRIFIQTLLFDALIGNNDRHGRNLGLIVTAKNTELSPMYDNVSYLSLEKGSMLKADFNPTGKISTQKTYEPSMRDYVIELKRLGYMDEIEDFYQRMNIAQIIYLIDSSFCTKLMKEALIKLMSKRFLELEHEFKN